MNFYCHTIMGNETSRENYTPSSTCSTPDIIPIDKIHPITKFVNYTDKSNKKVPQAYREAVVPYSNMISIEGNIGSGKSTFLKRIKESYLFGEIQRRLNRTVIFIPEPVDEWELIRDKQTNQSMIEKFYGNQKEYAFSFQMMAYITRLKILRDTIRENPNHILISERCLDTDRNIFAQMLYDDGLIKDVEFQIYTKWFEEFKPDINHNSHIYVKTEPKLCYERIQERNRKGETIPLEYLEKCHNYHQSWLKSRVDVMELQGEKNFRDDENEFETCMRKLLYFMNSMYPTYVIDKHWNDIKNEIKNTKNDTIFELTMNGC